MKKLMLASILMVSMSIGVCPVFTYAATKNSIKNQVRASQTMVLDGKEAPVLVIKASTDHEKNFDFELKLDGATWSYDEKGSFQNGVTFQKMSDTWLIVSVDMKKFDATKKDIEIPLNVEIISMGDASITVDGGETTVSSGEYSFASKAEGELKLVTNPIKRLGETGTLNDITIDDSSTGSVKEGVTYQIRLDNGFRFTNQITPVGSGKYNNAVSFSYDEDNPNDAVVTILENTPEGVGSITLSGAKVKKTKTSNFGEVNVSLVVGKDSLTEKVADFVKFTSVDTPLKLLYVNESSLRPLVVGEGLPGVIVKSEIDGKEFTTATIGANGRFTMQYPEDRKDLAEGDHVFTASYFDTSINQYVGEIEVEFETRLPYGVSFTIDSETYYVDGKAYSLDAPAYIDENGRTMLPLRAFVNALGISDKNVVWDNKDQTVTITREDGNKIQIKIGDSAIKINGLSKKIDTQAVIKNGRTYLPMRPLLNAMGINDNSIVWKPLSQTVIVELE